MVLCAPSLRARVYRASDKCQREKRKTINGDDLLWAMTTLGFENYVEPLKVYLARYREVRVGLAFLALIDPKWCDGERWLPVTIENALTLASSAPPNMSSSLDVSPTNSPRHPADGGELACLSLFFPFL